MSESVEDYVAVNRELWTRTNVQWTDKQALGAWQNPDLWWGVWHIPETDVHALPENVAGLDIVELGCGTAYVAAKLARRGARVVGVDPTPAQLATARRCQQELGLEFQLIEAPAEHVPLPDGAFDLVVSEYGASLWADPHLWTAEAARILRPGGRLVFLTNTPLSMLCSPDTGPVIDRLVRPQFGMYRIEFADEDGVGIEFHLSHGEWLRLLRQHGFDVLDLIELQAPPDAEDHPFYTTVPVAWGRKWPAEEIWVAEKKR
jgi:SAM-dependent methyltransferase